MQAIHSLKGHNNYALCIIMVQSKSKQAFFVLSNGKIQCDIPRLPEQIQVQGNT